MKGLGVFLVGFWAVALFAFAQEDNTPATKTDSVQKYPAMLPIDNIDCEYFSDDYDPNTAFLKAFEEWLEQHLQYPEDCQRKRIEGVVQVSLKIEKDGSINDVKIVSSPHPSLSKEVMRVVKSMPKCDPDQQADRRFGLRIVHPIRFRLNDQDAKSVEHRGRSKKSKKSRNRD